MISVFDNDTLNKHNTFVRILPGNGYSPLTDVQFNLNNKRKLYDQLFYENLFDTWAAKDVALNEYTKTLPTLFEYLEKNVYVKKV